jgi:site-specific DNA-methyltransferase (adenine-specific)
VKPYTIGGTITDNILNHEVGAMNIAECNINNASPTNLLEFAFKKSEDRLHEAQKPIDLIKYLIKLSTREGQVVLDPFMGSGTTAAAALSLNRQFIGFESSKEHWVNASGRIKNSNCEKKADKKTVKQEALF